MRKLFFFSACISVLGASAQRVVNVDHNNSANTNIYGNFYTVSGVPFSSIKYVRVASGSAYFSENWMKANLVLENGRVCNNIPIRLDLVENGLEYIDSLGHKMIAPTRVIKIDAVDTITGERFKFVHSLEMPASDIKLLPGWYLLLTEGNSATLYKYMSRSINERLSYGSATYEQHITAPGDYFILQESGMVKMKKLNELPELLVDKKEQLKTFIKNNKLFGKVDSDYIEVMNYYNSLN